ncbi:MAG TPA: hypothetical protein VGR37_17190 [Longimicrobiaceae bacterium]|nr:hypothetical protein [Longimicrobiaceae bacterium]
MPVAILLVLVGGALVLAFSALFARIGKLEGRIESLERRHADLMGIVSDVLIEPGRRETLEPRLRNLLSDR